MTALVGPSGGGKSTIAHLLAGFYPVDGGRIKIAGLVLAGDTVGEIQDLIAVVWQDSHIFYGTAYENILIGRSGATRGEVIKAARDANIHDFIESLPLGYNTILGERGIRFSGGERQRIVIARAFLRNAPLLFWTRRPPRLTGNMY